MRAISAPAVNFGLTQANLLCPVSPVNVSISSATSGGWSQAAKNAAWEPCSWSQTVGAQRGTKLLLKKKLILRQSLASSTLYFRSISIEKKNRGFIRETFLRTVRTKLCVSTVLTKTGKNTGHTFLYIIIFFEYIDFFLHHLSPCLKRYV